jgi:hypothetical protein
MKTRSRRAAARGLGVAALGLMAALLPLEALADPKASPSPRSAEPAALLVEALDYRGAELDPQRSHASLSRVLPSELGGEPDRDALSFFVIAEQGRELDGVEIVTRAPGGQPLDVMAKLSLTAAACPKGAAAHACFRTPPLRALADALDRNHPAARQRSILAQIGGVLQVLVGGQPLLELRVGGPRETRLGPIERLRARLRILVLRGRVGGAPALGGSDSAAARLIAQELATAASLWGQCGIELGPPGQYSVKIVDPPAARLLAVGCGFGQVASGGNVDVRLGARDVRLRLEAGESPAQVAWRLSEALAAAGQQASVFENQPTDAEALPTADVFLRAGPRLDRAGLSVISSDPTLPVCLGEVDFSDGLSHFGDGDAFAGTVEERALLRAFDDGDPRTIEVLVVPSFAHSSRIGESFMSSPGASLGNAVIIDRTAIRAGARSFALAHELGHVLLAMPGHPDDFGVDTPSSLMDADVADPTIFGPRRLSTAECERVVVQSGPGGLVPLLVGVPLR